MKQSTPSSSVSSRLPALLEKCSHWDKDERYMATNDLRLELLKGAAATPLDDAMEAKVCASVLKQLEDASSDVQAVAVQTLAVLFKRVRVGQIEKFSDKLCDLIIQGKTSLRDIYAICLRSLLSDVSEDVGSVVAERVALRLLGGIGHSPPAAGKSSSGSSSIRDNSDTELKRECIDTLSELLLRFGASVRQQHPRLVEVMVAQLDDDAHTLRKRAAVCIGSLAAAVSDELLAKLVHAVVRRTDNMADISRLSTSVHALGMVTRSVGRRVRTVMQEVVAVLLRCSDAPEDLAQEMQEGTSGGEDGRTNSRCDMVEFCLGGMEAVVRRCPRESRPFLPQIVDRACAYLAFDPNYNYAEEDEDNAGGDGAQYDDEYGYGDDGYDAGGGQDFYNSAEDDDASWKLRRAAARVLSAAALYGLPANTAAHSDGEATRTGLISRIGDALVGRVTERVEAVKIDVLDTLESLIAASGPDPVTGNAESASSDAQAYFASAAPRLVRACGRAASGAATDARVKSAVLGLYKALCHLLQDIPNDLFSDMLAFIETAVRDTNQAISLTACEALRAIVASSHTARRQVLISRLVVYVPTASACIANKWHKLVIAGLQLLESIICMLFDQEDNGTSCGGERGADVKVATLESLSLLHRVRTYSVPVEATEASSTLLTSACDVSSNLVASKDIDPDMKEALISLIGSILRVYGSSMQTHISSRMMEFLVASLESEETRLFSIKAICAVGASDTFASILRDGANFDATLAAVEKCLKLQDRALCQWSMRAVSLMVARCPVTLLRTVATRLLTVTIPFVSDGDGTVCQFALHSIGNVFFRANPDLSTTASSELLDVLVKCTSTSLISDTILREVQFVFFGLSGGVPDAVLPVVYVDRSALLDSVASAAVSHFVSASSSGGTSLRQLLSQAARCIAAVAVTEFKLCERMVSKCVSEFSRDNIDAAPLNTALSIQLALYIVAEIGRLCDLSPFLVPHSFVFSMLPCLQAQLEDTKFCAVLALGHAASSNTAAYVPEIIALFKHVKAQVDTDPRVVGLFLSVTKEIFQACDAKKVLVSSVDDVFSSLLVPLLSSSDDGIRNLAAECIGTACYTYTNQGCAVLTEILFGNIYGDSDRSLRKASASHLLRVALSTTRSMEQMFSIARDSVARCLGETFNFGPQDDANARRWGLHMLHSILTNNPHAFLRHVSIRAPFYMEISLIDAVLASLQYKMERVIDLGPFKHKIDDGLIVRRTALSVLDAMFSTNCIPAEVIMSSLPAPMQSCLVDKDEIQVQAYHVASNIFKMYPSLFSLLDSAVVCKSMTKTLFPEKPASETGDATSSENAVGAAMGADRSKEVGKAMVRFLVTMEMTRETPLDENWGTLIKRVASNHVLSGLFVECTKASESRNNID